MLGQTISRMAQHFSKSACLRFRIFNVFEVKNTFPVFQKFNCVQAMKFSQPILFLLVLSLCWVVGCGSTRDADFVKASNDTNLKKIGNLYRLYASRLGYHGPKSKEEFKNFLSTNDQIVENLKLMGVDRDKLDEYFISENDGKEFRFRWGVFVNPDVERSKEPLVFETDGKNGVRLVMLSNEKILEVTDEKKYQAMLKGNVDPNEAKTDAEKGEEAAVNEPS